MSIHKASNTGYTVIEIAIVIAVVGISMASASKVYNTWQKNQIMTATSTNSKDVMSAIGDFLVQHGRYPCPAPLNVTRSNPKYGMETDCTDTSVAPGTCSASGYCVEQSELVPARRVRRGAIPFRALNLPEFLSEDGYHSRLQYAVTEQLAVASTFSPAGGGISIVNGMSPPESLITPQASAPFLIFSSGQDKAGAYTSEGQQPIPCNAAAMDGENCNTSASNKTAVYRSAPFSSGTGAEHFDDYVRIPGSATMPLWMGGDDNSNNMHDAGVVNSIGIGQAPTNPANKLEIAGNARASVDPVSGNGGAMHIDRICDNTAGGNCFNPNKIGGTQPEMDCSNPANPNYDATKPYTQSVGGTGTDNSARVICRAAPVTGCPAGQAISGYTSSGDVTCVAIPPVNGVCGASNGTTTATMPTSLCNAGTASAVSGGGATPWTWSCVGLYGGSTANCSAVANPNANLPTVTCTAHVGPSCGGGSTNLYFQAYTDANGQLYTHVYGTGYAGYDSGWVASNWAQAGDSNGYCAIQMATSASVNNGVISWTGYCYAAGGWGCVAWNYGNEIYGYGYGNGLGPHWDPVCNNSGPVAPDPADQYSPPPPSPSGPMY